MSVHLLHVVRVFWVKCTECNGWKPQIIPIVALLWPFDRQCGIEYRELQSCSLTLEMEVHIWHFSPLVPQRWERVRAVSSGWYLGSAHWERAHWGDSPDSHWCEPLDL